MTIDWHRHKFIDLVIFCIVCINYHIPYICLQVHIAIRLETDAAYGSKEQTESPATAAAIRYVSACRNT